MIDVAATADDLAALGPVADAAATPVDVDRVVVFETAGEVGLGQGEITVAVAYDEHAAAAWLERLIDLVLVGLLVPTEAVVVLAMHEERRAGTVGRLAGIRGAIKLENGTVDQQDEHVVVLPLSGFGLVATDADQVDSAWVEVPAIDGQGVRRSVIVPYTL